MSSVFDHQWLSGLFGDQEVAAIWSADTQLKHMLAFEAAWSRAGHLAGLWSKAEGQEAADAIASLDLTPSQLADGTGRDGVCVPELVRQIRSATGKEAVHKGATSQDVIDTATSLSIAATISLFVQRLEEIDRLLQSLEDKFGEKEIVGRTRMQAAVPMRLENRLRAWRAPLSDYRETLSGLFPQVAQVQVGGAVGDRASLGKDGDAMVMRIADELGLTAALQSWHNTRENLVHFASCLSLVSGSLGKMGMDICLMSQQGVDEIVLEGGGGSSAMPHKQNPVLAELLVTLARFNAVQVSGMHQALVHEQERSGAAWSFEWMILPQMAQTTGRSLSASAQLLSQVKRLGLS
jgi:3-carboxy-cis,cis-muconate cycloisomerase